MNDAYEELFTSLTNNLEDFIHEFENNDNKLMATDEWDVKDELCHITFWHENYASNYKALAENRTPILPDGMSTINTRGVLALRNESTKVLIERLRAANESLYNSIVVKKVPKMTYSKKGRTYTTEYFLEMIIRHLITHTKQIKHAR